MRFQFPRRAAFILVETLALTFQCGNLLFQTRLVQQVGVAGKDSHVLREVHTRFLVHAALVDGTCAHSTAFQLRDKSLLAVQQVELIAVQRFFHRIDNHIHLIISKELGNLVALSHRPPVTLGEVGWSPRCIKVMKRNRPFLCVYTRSEHTRRAEQYPHLPLVHGIYHRFA